MKTHILYKITYIPHLNTHWPKHYIGSKHDYKGVGSYYGSPSSKQIFEYTGKDSLKIWWKTLDRKDLIIEVLQEYHDITPQTLIEYERDLHIQLDVLNSNKYFNNAIATLGWVSNKKSNETKRIISMKTKEYWDSPAGLLKKERLSLRNTELKTNKKASNSTKNKMSKVRIGVLKTNITKSKMSISAKNRKKIKCEYCDIITSPHLISRWHSDNCKHKGNI